MKVFWAKLFSLLPFFIFLIIISYLAYNSAFFIKSKPVIKLIFSSNWRPSNGEFGFFNFWFSSFYITVLSAMIFIPIGFLISVYISHYCKKKYKIFLKTILDILSGIPSIIFGYWGFLLIVPFISFLGKIFGIPTSGYSILSASIVLSFMVLPIYVSLLSELFEMVPQELKEAALSLGLTKFEMVKNVIIPKCKNGIIASIFLSLGRVIGETMAVMMVVGCIFEFPKTPFDPAYPIPALIANNFGEMMSIPNYREAILFSALLLNLIVFIFHFLLRRAFFKTKIK